MTPGRQRWPGPQSRGFVFVGPTTAYAAMRPAASSTTISSAAIGAPGEVASRVRHHRPARVCRLPARQRRHPRFGGRRPGADRLDRAGGDLPVLHPAVGRAVVPAGHGHGLPEHPAGRRRGTVQQNAWAFYPFHPLPRQALVVLTSADPVLVTSTLSLVLGAAAAVLLRCCFAAGSAWHQRCLSSSSGRGMPPAWSLQVAYTESHGPHRRLLLAVETRRWPLRGGCLHCSPGWLRPIAALRGRRGTGRRGAALAVGPRRRARLGRSEGLGWSGWSPRAESRA